MKRIITGLAGLLFAAQVKATDLNVNLAPQMTNYGNAVHAELTLSDFYGKGIVEAGLEKDIGREEMPNFKTQVIQFLPRGFSAGALVRIGSDEHFNPSHFLYLAIGPGHSFAKGKVNASISGQVNISIQEGRFEKPDFGITGYLGYEPAKGLTVYAIGSTSKGFQLARAGAKFSLPKLYKK